MGTVPSEAEESPVSESPDSAGPRNADLLGIYVNDHLAAATGGIELVTRMIGVHRGGAYEQPLVQLLDEFLASAVRGKRSGFETLREVAEVEPRLDAAELDRLIAQANRQYEWLTHTRRDVAAGVFGGRPAAAEVADR
jgi:hypothetical protein